MAGIVVFQPRVRPPGRRTAVLRRRLHGLAGERAAIVGSNGASKTTLLRILAGELDADAGMFALGGRALYMPQDVGLAGAGITVRDMLVEAAPPRPARRRQPDAGRRAGVAAGGDDGAGLALATAIADWADLGATTSSSAGTRPHSGWSGPAWARWASARRHCRAASASGWCWPCCSARTPTSCCSTSPTTTSTSRPGPGSSLSCRPVARPC